MAVSRCTSNLTSTVNGCPSVITVKLEMFADINVCEFVILKVFALLKFAILVLPKVNFVFLTNSVLLLLLLIGYIRSLV